MDVTLVLRKVGDAWTAFTASYGGLPPADMTTPSASGEWSIKDIIAHVTTWEEEALKYLPLLSEGGKPPRYADLYGGVDAFNAQMAAQKRTLPLDEVLTQQSETHDRLVEYIGNAPPELFARETPFRRRIRLDTYSHYPHHTSAILEWRQQGGR